MHLAWNLPALRLVLLLATAVLTTASSIPTAAAQFGEAAAQFALSSAFQSAERQQATGLYVLGTTRIRSWAATHYILIRDGRGVQIHTKANGVWLPKLEGSSGGLLIGSAKFDELLSIAGGVNRDAEGMPAAARDRFYCLAGFGGCAATALSVAERTHTNNQQNALRPWVVSAHRVLLLPLVGDAHAAVSPCQRCQQYFTLGEGARTLKFDFEAATRRILFDGWGIRASWLAPPLDEI